MRIRKGDEWKTAFRTRYGLFEYQVLPFGLANASASFQAYINRALSERLDVSVIVYLDDILIYSEDPVKHDDDVIWVLKQLDKYGLYISLDKCRFGTTEVHFLGYVVSPQDITMQKDKLDAIRNWPVPKNINDIQTFLGLANFYRRFIRNFSRIAAPLSGMLKGSPEAFRRGKSKKRKRSPSPLQFKEFLTVEAKQAFEKLKACFIEEPLLHHFDLRCRLRVETDASNKAIGDVLCQQDTNSGNWHPITYFSFKMNPAQCNYETHDQELLAIVEAFKHWRHYLKGAQHEVLVLTDHHNLKKFMHITKLSSRRVRWAQELSRYNFSIDYRQGKKNPADALSRRSDLMQESNDAAEENRQTLHRLQESLRLSSDEPGAGAEAERAHVSNVKTDIVLFQNRNWQTLVTGGAYVAGRMKRTAAVKQAMESEKTFDEEAATPLVQLIPKLLLEDPFAIELRKRLATSEEVDEAWADEDGVLRHDGKLYVPESLRTDVLKQCHDDPLADHFGTRKTLSLVQRRYF